MKPLLHLPVAILAGSIVQLTGCKESSPRPVIAAAETRSPRPDRAMPATESVDTRPRTACPKTGRHEATEFGATAWIYRTVRPTDVYVLESARAQAMTYFCTLDSGSALEVDHDADQDTLADSSAFLDLLRTQVPAPRIDSGSWELFSLCRGKRTADCPNSALEELAIDIFGKRQGRWGRWLPVAMAGRKKFQIFSADIEPIQGRARIPGYRYLEKIPSYGFVPTESDPRKIEYLGDCGLLRYELRPGANQVRLWAMGCQEASLEWDVRSITRTGDSTYRLRVRGGSYLGFYTDCRRDQEKDTLADVDITLGDRSVDFHSHLVRIDPTSRCTDENRTFIRPEALASTKIVYEGFDPEKDIPPVTWNEGRP